MGVMADTVKPPYGELVVAAQVSGETWLSCIGPERVIGVLGGWR